MNYEPTNWKDGDLVTSTKLNKIEQGIAEAGVLVVGIDLKTGTLDKTWQEIHDAGFVVVKPNNMITTAIGYVSMIGQSNGAYVVQIWIDEGSVLCTTNSADGYPVMQDSDPTKPDSE